MSGWFRCTDSKQLEEILSIVEPNNKENQAILKCINETEIYRSYIYKDNGTIDAICIATLLSKTQTLHIEDFALHPRIRGKGKSYPLWNSWLKFIIDEEKWIPNEDY